ncbi:MAG TPA: hypothetical protein PK493_18095 [Pseudomonadota bacterium]|nr:hypothetical protein [Pseudomonadota bacterium]
MIPSTVSWVCNGANSHRAKRPPPGISDDPIVRSPSSDADKRPRLGDDVYAARKRAPIAALAKNPVRSPLVLATLCCGRSVAKSSGTSSLLVMRNVAWGRKGRFPDLASSESAPRKRVVGVPLAPRFLAMVLMVPPASGNHSGSSLPKTRCASVRVAVSVPSPPYVASTSMR